MKTWLSEIRENPLELLVGICILMVAASGGAVRDVASTAIGVMFIASLFYIKNWGPTWRILEKAEKLVLIGFALYALTALFSWMNADDSSEFIKQYGRYIRFALIAPVYLMIRAKQLDMRKYFVAGVVLSGFVYLGMAISSIEHNPNMPASGQYHHITFGDAAMLSVGLMGVMLLFFSCKPMYRFLISISLICAAYAVVLSQARGAWVVLPLYLAVALGYLLFVRRSDAVKLVVISSIAVVALQLSPAGTIIEKRLDKAVAEVSQFAHAERYDTSIGGRISMWIIAYEVWKENPILGTGLGDFDEDIVRYQAMGYFPEIDVHGSTHNIFVQALVSTGIIGFLALCYGLLIMPLKIFIRLHDKDQAWGVMGIVLVTSYAIFGLSESWTLRAPVVSIYITYLIALMASMNHSLFERNSWCVLKY